MSRSHRKNPGGFIGKNVSETKKIFSRMYRRVCKQALRNGKEPPSMYEVVYSIRYDQDCGYYEWLLEDPDGLWRRK